MKTIGYLGPEGTFSHLALEAYLKRAGASAHAWEASSILDLFAGLSEKKCDEIIVPVENSVEGSVTTTLDLLAQGGDGLRIKSELSVDIVHCLMGLPGTNIDLITDIVSHPQVLAQCAHYIHSRLKNVITTHQSSSTAIAAKQIKAANGYLLPDAKTLEAGALPEGRAASGTVFAVIGNAELAERYGLEILESPVNDYPNNKTRFELIGYEETPATGVDKTSVVLSMTKDKPGGLYEVLGEFAKRNINLTKISSRPTKAVLGEYIFFIDFEGHIQDAMVKETMAAIQPKISYYKFLGSYQREVPHD